MKSLTTRQFLVLAGGSAAVVGVAATLMMGSIEVAIGLVAVLNLLLLLGLVQIRRRIGQVATLLQHQRRRYRETRQAADRVKSEQDDRLQVVPEKLDYAERRQGIMLERLERIQKSMAEVKSPGVIQTDSGDRSNLLHHTYVQIMSRALAANASSVIDVGSWGTSPLEALTWISHRDALDLHNPYQSENVRGIRADFRSFSPSTRYDLALCLQVLDQIPEPEAFARHLLKVAENVLVSVQLGANVTHLDGNNETGTQETLRQWIGREPDYEVVVTEPFATGEKSQWLIAYYHSVDEAFALHQARERVLLG